MSLSFVGSRNYINQVGFVDLPFVLNSQIVIIDIDSNQKKGTWNKAGDALQVIKLGTLDCEVSDSYTYLSFNPTLIKFPLVDGNNYLIRVKPVPWLTNFTVNVYKWLGN